MNAPLRSKPESGDLRLTAYRPFIDGLRAVSIVSVVLYHVGVPGVTGGFVGVDIFFVISGFLIITQIVEGLAAGRFSFGDFWSRRALRILPPYLLVMAFAMAVAPFALLMPDHFKDFGKEVGHAGVMVVNHLFLIQQGYFDGASDTKPLLHLWSLAVEEQFYLAAPLILGSLWFVMRRLREPEAGSRLLSAVATGVFAASLAGCIWFTGSEGGRNYAFYLAPLRAWEFIAGGAIGAALPSVRRLPRAAIEALAAAGLLAILTAVLAYSPDTPYPSFRALLPVLGAVAVILAGLADPGIRVARWLALPGMVWIGLVSYSWYLWHWPLLAFARVSQFGERHFWIDLPLAAVSLGLAAATHYWIERPIRAWRQARKRPFGWTPVIAGTVVCSAVAIGGLLGFDAVWKHMEETVPPQYVPHDVLAAPYCDLQFMHSAQECQSLAGGRPLGLLVGDSHATAARSSIADFEFRHGSMLLSFAAAGCVALIGTTALNPDHDMADRCSAMKANGLPLLAGGGVVPSYAILYSRWPLYGSGKRQYALGNADDGAPADDQDALFIAELRKTIALVQSFGVERLMIIGPTPAFPRSVPSCLYLADRYRMDRATTCGVERADADAYRATAVARIAAAISGLAGVRYLDPLADFCDARRCLPYDGDAVLFSDTNHMSEAGMSRIIAAHQAEFAWVTGSAR